MVPRGAFYAFPSIRRFGLNSEEFAERLLMEERVAVVPGGAFVAGEPCRASSLNFGMPDVQVTLSSPHIGWMPNALSADSRDAMLPDMV